LRSQTKIRPVQIEKIATAAPGSLIYKSGETTVLCTASYTTDLPGWLAGHREHRGWVTAEYNMLPSSTFPRKKRSQDSRSIEIQRLVGRSLRAAVNTALLNQISVFCDCEVIKADGGTRTAAINGASIALKATLDSLLNQGLLKESPFVGHVVAVSVGILRGQPVLDLDYEMDSQADVDLNVVFDHSLNFVEIQGTGERTTFSPSQLQAMLDLAREGATEILQIQNSVTG